MMRSHRLPQRRRRGSHQQRRRPPPPPPPELIDDAIAEILLHLAPDDPACLVRASLVCKLWHRILSEPTFPDRYREFHQTPPLLGFLSGSYNGFDKRAGHFVPTTTTRIPFRRPEFGCRALDCRHGRVLFDMVDGTGIMGKARSANLAVWDPVTGGHKVLSNPNQVTEHQSGAVLCSAAGCNHRGCHGSGGPFLVAFVSYYNNPNHGTNNVARAWVYSSETASWSTPVSVQIKFDDYASAVETKRAAVVQSKIYFLLTLGAGILEYDLGKGCLTVIGSPCTHTHTLQPPGMLMAMEDGLLLGFASVVVDFSTLHLWTTKVNPNGSIGWVQDRVISLTNLPVSIIGTVDASDNAIDVVGFAEGVDILLLAIEDGRGFMFELKSGQFRKLSRTYYYYDDFSPYLSFYIPDFCSRK